jgi:hypothetical protein
VPNLGAVNIEVLERYIHIVAGYFNFPLPKQEKCIQYFVKDYLLFEHEHFMECHHQSEDKNATRTYHEQRRKHLNPVVSNIFNF